MDADQPTVRSDIWSLLQVVLCALLVIAVAGLLLWGSLPAADAPPAASVTAQIPLYGFNLALDGGALDTALDQIETLWPAYWVRVPFDWARIEALRGQYDWETVDQAMRAASRPGAHVIAVLETSPVWSRRSDDAEFTYAPPLESRDFALFVAACVERYGDVIDAYQIWDEPNIHPHWGSRYVSAEEYVGLLREGAIQVRAGDPDAWVLAGGLAPNTEPAGLNQNDLDFLREMYAAGAAEWFDALAAKPYGLREPADSAPDAGVLNFQRVALLHEIMQAAGDGDTPIWAVEFGWNSLPADWAGEESPWGTTDETQQIEWVAAAIDMARQKWPWMGPMLWADWQPAGGPTDPRWGFAALTAEGEPRAILEYLRTLPPAPAVAGIGVHGFLEPSVAFEGDWRVDVAGADIGDDGSAFSIRFAGADLDLTVRRGNYWAYFDVWVDGEPANALPCDESGQSYLVLYDPLGEEATLPIAAGLPDGEHVARFVAHGGWNQWALASFTVRGDATTTFLTSLREWAIPAGLVVGVLALLWLFWLIRRRRFSVAWDWTSTQLRTWIAAWQSVPLWARAGALMLAGACYLFVPISPVALLGLAAMAFLLLLWPHGGLVLAAAAIPFFLNPPRLFGFSLPGVELIIWLTALALCAHELVVGRRLSDLVRRLWHTRNWIDLGALLLLFSAILSTIAARNVGVAGHELRVVFFDSVLLYFLWRALPAEPDGDGWMWLALDALVAAGVAVALMGIGQRLLHVDLIAAEGVWRVRGPYGSPNNLSLYLERIVPIALAVGVSTGSRRRRWTYLLAAAPLLVALVLTYSRGALLLGLPAALVVMGWLRGGKWRWGTLTLLAIIAVALIPLAGVERFTTLIDFGGGTNFFRLKLWQGSWNMVKDHPWLGVGPDNFLYAYRTRFVLPSAWEELNLSHPHNIVLDVLTRLGLLGSIALVVLLAPLYRRLLALARGDGGGWFLGLLGSMVAFLAHGLVDNSFFLVDLALVCMMTAGIVARWSAGQKPAPRGPAESDI